MNDCDKIRLDLEAYQSGQLPEQARRLVASHLESCPDCRNVLAQLKQVATILHKWPDITPQADFIEAVNEQIDELGIHEYLNNLPSGKAGRDDEPGSEPMPKINLGYRLRYVLATAAALLVAVIVWLTGNKPLESTQPISINDGTVAIQQNNQTPETVAPGTYYINNEAVMQTAQTKAVLSLPDKTRIEMDRLTALNIIQPPDKSRKNIMLRQGSIYLAVTKNPVPLYVETEAGRIKVVGTRFRVNHLKYNTQTRTQANERLTHDEGIRITTVSVDEGAVQVEWKDFVYPVKPGQKIAFSISIKPTRFELPAGNDTSNQINNLLSLIKQFSQDNDIDNALAAEAILVGFGEDIIPKLMAILKSESSGQYNTKHLGRILSLVGSENLYPELEAIIKSGQYAMEYRVVAAEALLGINQPDGANVLLKIFNSSANPDTMKLCLDALQNKRSIGLANTAELIKILVTIIKKGESRDNPMFNTAIESLASLSDNSGLPMLYDLINQEADYRVVLSASRAIARLGDKSDLAKILNRLYSLADDKNDLVKLAAIKTIMGLETGSGKQRLITRMVDIGLASTDPKVKLACLETAVILGNPQAFELFKDIINQKNSDLCLQAIQKITRITASDTLSGFAVELLAAGYYDLINRWKRTQGQEYRTLADQIARSVEGIKNHRVLPAIRGLLNSSETDLVISAVRVLANIGEKEDIFTLRAVLGRVTDEKLKAELTTAIETLRTTLDFRDE